MRYEINWGVSINNNVYPYKIVFSYRQMIGNMNKLLGKKNEIILFFIVFGIAGFFVFVSVIQGENFHLCINDNLDSNIPIFKMIRDNNMFWDLEKEIPFLRGDITRGEYHIGLSLEAWIYMLFPPLAAYIVTRLLAYFMSVLGFFLIAKTASEVFKFDSFSFILCGIIYGLLGTWPHAALGFASIPLWVAGFFSLFCTHNYKLLIFFPFFITTVSFPLIGIWLLFYTIAIVLILLFFKRRFDMLLPIIEMIIIFGILYSGLISQSFGNNAETIKGLVRSKYSDSIIESVLLFPKVFLFYHFYHTGAAVLRYVVIPVCVIYIIFSLEKIIIIRGKENHKEIVLSIFIFCLIIINTIVASFDNNYFLRTNILPFLNGFSLGRIHYLSPFLWLFLLAIFLNLFGKYFISVFSLFMIIIFSLALDPSYHPLNSMYNDFHIILKGLFKQSPRYDMNHQYTWAEWYSTKLFDVIKHDISYKGEWSIGFGIDPGVLNFNKINTTDGYYSNYSMKFHDEFQELIQPQLDIDEGNRVYWDNTGGYRAILYSTNWNIWTWRNFSLSTTELNVDKKKLHEMTYYVFSRVEIANANNLDLTLLGCWDGDNYNSPYTVFVYRIRK